MAVTRRMPCIRGGREALVASGLATLLIAGGTGVVTAQAPIGETQRLIYEHVLRENGRLRPGVPVIDLLLMNHQHVMRENAHRATPPADPKRLLHEHVVRENDRD